MTARFIPSLPTTALAGALLAAFSLGASASDETGLQVSREQVRAEYVRARTAEELATPADLYGPVRQALIDARRARQTPAESLALQGPAQTRARVQASAAK